MVGPDMSHKGWGYYKNKKSLEKTKKAIKIGRKFGGFKGQRLKVLKSDVSDYKYRARMVER
jgi:hypothetical protein